MDSYFCMFFISVSKGKYCNLPFEILQLRLQNFKLTGSKLGSTDFTLSSIDSIKYGTSFQMK